jgi:hypothetical protein
MKRPCRNRRAPCWRRRREDGSFALRHVRILTDPKKLAQLKAEAEAQRHKP